MIARYTRLRRLCLITCRRCHCRLRDSVFPESLSFEPTCIAGALVLSVVLVTGTGWVTIALLTLRILVRDNNSRGLWFLTTTRIVSTSLTVSSWVAIEARTLQVLTLSVALIDMYSRVSQTISHSRKLACPIEQSYT